MPKRFNDEWWEHISLVNTIMLYKMALDGWGSEESENRIKELIKDSHDDIERLEEKIDLIMKKLNIETLDKF